MRFVWAILSAYFLLNSSLIHGLATVVTRMEKDYAPPEATIYPPLKTSCVQEAQEFPALRKFHFWLLLIGGLSLILAITFALNVELVAAKKAEYLVKGIADREIREQWRSELITTYQNESRVVAGIKIAEALGLLSCGIFVFHFPVFSTSCIFIWYLLSSAMLLSGSFSGADPFGALGLILRSLILLSLLWAMRTAHLFMRDFKSRNRVLV